MKTRDRIIAEMKRNKESAKSLNAELRTAWIDWMKSEGNERHSVKPMTNMQSKFIDFLVENVEQLDQIGDVAAVFKSFYAFLKYAE